MEEDGVVNSRIKSTKDHLEIQVHNGSITKGEATGTLTLQSTPRQCDSSILGCKINGQYHFVPLPKTLLMMDKLFESSHCKFNA